MTTFEALHQLPFRKLSNDEKMILREIGNFYLTKNKNSYNECCKELDKLGIKNIIFNRNVINIDLECPGLLIGSKGENIKKLKTYLIHFLNETIEINFYENKINSFLYPVDYSSNYDDLF